MALSPGRQFGSSIPQLEHSRFPLGVHFHTPIEAGDGGGGGALKMLIFILPLINIAPFGVFIIALHFNSFIEGADINTENK
jgi:hypothetical protein